MLVISCTSDFLVAYRVAAEIYNGIAKFQLAETLLMSQLRASPLDFVSA